MCILCGDFSRRGVSWFDDGVSSDGLGAPAAALGGDIEVVPTNTGDLASVGSGGSVTWAAASDASVNAAALPVYSFDQIASYLTTEYWGGPVSHWRPGSTITFNVQGLLPAAQSLARAAFAAWQGVTNLTFVNSTSTANIMLDDTQQGAFATSNSVNGITTSAFVNVARNWSGESNPGLDSYTFQTFLHEIGHTLGLGHGGPYNGSAVYGMDNIYQNDTWGATVMSYFSQENYNGASMRFVASPMLADIIAVQNIYGANMATRSGDTVYGHNSNAGAPYNFASFVMAPSYTIWDGGGSDTLDASGYAANQIINLAAESSSSIGGLSQNILIARNTVIENARGGSGNDTIVGNDAGNTLSGGRGADTLSGGAGIDTLGYHLDPAGGTARGIYVNLASNVAVDTGGAIDVLAGFESIVGTNNPYPGGYWSDFLYGDAGANVIAGLGGNDYFAGGLGIDYLVGGAGTDWFIMNGDIVAGGYDVIGDFNSGGTTDYLVIPLAQQANTVFGNWGGYAYAYISLSGGNAYTILVSGITGAQLQGHVFFS